MSDPTGDAGSQYTEVEVIGESADTGYPAYWHTFSGARPLSLDLARTIGVAPDADPLTVARAFAALPGFTRSMKPGSVRLRQRTVTISPWEVIEP